MAKRFSVRGVVQGVGFRPFVYRLAHKHGLAGWVANSSAGVVIEVAGKSASLEAFERDLTERSPVLARIDSVETEDAEDTSAPGAFEIRSSERDPAEITLICPDVAACPECMSEFFDADDRRHHYPFINCTNCGPRFSIIEATPYDRPATSMSVFRMCDRCQAEYDDPLDRRFHAQPNACPDCGPSLELVMPGPEGALAEKLLGRSYLRMPEDIRAAATEDPARAARWLLMSGAIVGVRGLGGFHIAADAANDETVRVLREKKNRPAKPFAIMCRSLEVARELAHTSPVEEEALTSPWSPVVLLRKRGSGDSGTVAGTGASAARVSELVAPDNAWLGVMLPYAPVHHMLFGDGLDSLVMTSANRSGEPIVDTIESARERLPGITRTFLTHDREIVNRNDDSVVFVEDERLMMSRRSRGYAPYPIDLDRETARVLACGTELKNTFTVLDNGRAFVSQHIGDLANQATLDLYAEMVGKFSKWFRFEPEVVAYDLHPDYLATRFAREFVATRDGDVALEGVQHHHAHIVSVMAENRVDEPVIGIALDGTGYGTDGAIWGGEFLIADLAGFERAGHIRYTPLPGGDAAIKHPYRVALSHMKEAGFDDLRSAGLSLFPGLPCGELDLVVQQIERGINSVDTSSAGRLFDAASAILGVCREISYEAQAAIELESLLTREGDESEGTVAYPYDIVDQDGVLVIDPSRTILSLVEAVAAGDERARVASQFHETVVAFCRDAVERLSALRGITTVALSGGVFQNRYLLRRLSSALERDGNTVLVNIEVPTNDGGVSLGQAVVASERQRGKA